MVFRFVIFFLLILLLIFPRSLGIPRPKEETLSRHSILGPNGLYGQWQPAVVNTKVQFVQLVGYSVISEELLTFPFYFLRSSIQII